MKISKKELVIYSLFFGGLWGLLEATLGYVLNMIPYGLSGCIMFPIAFVILTKAYTKTGSTKVIYFTTVIAASIKLTNLVLPFLHPVKVINPAFAILLEGFAVGILIAKTMDKEKEIKPAGILVASMSWRVIYFAEVLVLYYLDLPSRMIEQGTSAIMEFFTFGVINAIIIILYVKLVNYNGMSQEQKPAKWQPAFAVILPILAVVIQIATTM